MEKSQQTLQNYELFEQIFEENLAFLFFGPGNPEEYDNDFDKESFSHSCLVSKLTFCSFPLLSSANYIITSNEEASTAVLK